MTAAKIFYMAFLCWDENLMLEARYGNGFDDRIKEGGSCFIKLLNTLVTNGKQEEFQIALTDKSNRNEFYKKYDII